MEPFKAGYTKSADAANALTSPSAPMNAVRVHKVLDANVKSPGEVRCVGRNMMHIACDVVRPTKKGKGGAERRPFIFPSPSLVPINSQPELAHS